MLGLSAAHATAYGAFATMVIALVAVMQMGQSRRQTKALEDQIAASVAQNDAVREAARAQVQPIVFATIVLGIVRGRDEGYDVGKGELGFPYRLGNEGTGVALNVTHGVEVAGVERSFGDGMEVRSLTPGEILPPAEGLDMPRPLVVVFREDELPEKWSPASRIYWVRFENVFGDRFETRNPLDPHQSAEFIRIEDAERS